MKINYRSTFGDIVAFSWHHQTRSPFLIGLILILSGFISWNTCWSLTEEYSTVIIAISWFMITAIIFAIMFFLSFSISVLAVISRKNKTFLTENTVELTDNGIITENRYGRSELVWDIVQKLKRTKRYILIYTAQSKAIIVPKRAFPSNQEWDEFYEILKSHYRRGPSS